MVIRLAAHAMGTRFEIVVSGDDPAFLRTVAEEAIDRIEDAEQRLSVFRPGSLLSHVNRAAGLDPVAVDGETLRLLAECVQVTRDSGGAFDVTVAPLMQAWGFRDCDDRDAADPRRAADRVGMDGVELDHERHTVSFRRPGVAIDLGGIGKGHALDAAAEVVREHGATCALLHGGTSFVVAIGAPPGTPGWRVALHDAGCPVTVTLRDAALGVSAPRGRTIARGDGPLGHVIDPASGRPADGVRLAAVVAPTAQRADAWSTALVVLGRRPAGLPADLSTFLSFDGDRPPAVGGTDPGLFSMQPDLVLEQT